ncbi:MAG: hypothetical protein ACFCUT_03030 [Kiloniellaceae bacterium]
MHLPQPQHAARGLAAAVLLATVLTAGPLPGGLQAADSTRCASEIDDHLAALPLAPGDVKSIRIIERVNLEDFGPEIFGVDAWVRLNSCSGWLVIDMRPTCYVLQTYTRGDCRVEGLPSY